MTRLGSRVGGMVCLVVAVCAAGVSSVYAISLDEEGTIKLGVRSYAASRVGTEDTNIFISPTRRNYTFPVSASGHVRQLRGFVEAELDNDIMRLYEKGVGPLSLLHDLPFEFEKLRYHVTYRGEYEGVYDFGPLEYRDSGFSRGANFFNTTPATPTGLVPPPVLGTIDPQTFRDEISTDARRRLRRIGVIRNRLFQAFLDAQVGNVFIRFGRQILSWGETDNFRLIDNINPLDNSFGGFLVSLDERRVPLNMLLANYYFGEVGPFSEVFLEGYAAVDKSVSYSPGTPAGSPWTLPNLGAPSASTLTLIRTPAFRISDARGGGILKFIAPIPGIGETNFSLAHYYTYLDVPFVKSAVSTSFPAMPINSSTDFGALAIQSTRRTQITGGTTSFTIPSRWARVIGLGGEPVIRSELAYFRDEPRFRQVQLDPFLYKLTLNQGVPFSNAQCPNCVTGGSLSGDSWNYVLGIDMNQFIRFLNPTQSFFFTTQFFYKHLLRVKKTQPVASFNPALGNDREVLPVPQFTQVFPTAASLGAVDPKFVTNPQDQYLQTLLISTSYYSGQVNPAFVVFYDWSGSVVIAPTVTLSRDPFRFTFQYNYLTAGTLKGASGVSLLRDRDNVLFQFEYVI